MPCLKAFPISMGVALVITAIALAVPSPPSARAEDGEAHPLGISLADSGSQDPFHDGGRDFVPPPATAPVFEGHDYGASSREFARRSVRRGIRTYGNAERERVFSDAGPGELGRYGRDDVAGRFREFQDRQNNDPYGTRPGK
ncbi:MAG: hypothetical protein LBR80_08895 [Deltaproteobacteria bacterium]|jgi:hypothetical protein|nr:hypothetical protein [Deltaproteobacteria bacterium]